MSGFRWTKVLEFYYFPNHGSIPSKYPLKTQSQLYKKPALYPLCAIFGALFSHLGISRIKIFLRYMYWAVSLLTSLSWCFTICSSKNSSSSSATRVASHPPASGSSRLSWELKSSARNKSERRRWGDTKQLSLWKNLWQVTNSHFCNSQRSYLHSTYKRKAPRIAPLPKGSHFCRENVR